MLEVYYEKLVAERQAECDQILDFLSDSLQVELYLGLMIQVLVHLMYVHPFYS